MEHSRLTSVLSCIQWLLWMAVVFVHLTCIILLRMNKLPHRNSLINLNIVQILYLVVQNVIWCLDSLHVESYFVSCLRLFKFNVVIIPWNNFIFVIIGERLVQTLLKIRNASEQDESNRNAKLMALLCWIVGALSFMICTGASTRVDGDAILQGQTLILQAYQGIIFMTFIFTYGLALRYGVSSPPREESNAKQICKTNPFRTSCLSYTYFSNSTDSQLFWICLAYTFFVIVPSFLKYIFNGNQPYDNISPVGLVHTILYTMDCLIVNLICILMNTDMRKGFTDSNNEPQVAASISLWKQNLSDRLSTKLKKIVFIHRNKVRDEHVNVSIQ